MKSGRAKIGILQKLRIKNLRGVSEVRFKKTRLLHLGNVEKPPHPQFFAQLKFKFIYINPQAPVAQKSADEVVFRHFQGE